MNSEKTYNWNVVGFLVLFLALPGWAVAQTNFGGIVVFGTSFYPILAMHLR